MGSVNRDTMPLPKSFKTSVVTLRTSTIALSVLLLCATNAGCGSERTSSGVWRELTCDDSDQIDCRETAYELHLGRYGRTVTGTVVRYRRQDGLDSYQRSYECGCFFIQGGRVVDPKISFGLYEPQNNCPADVPDVGRGECSDCECPLRRFRLEEIDGQLVGTTSCSGEPEREIRFELSTGRPRTQCKDINQR